MLGPEQINFVPRPAPMMLDAAATIKVTEQVARGMGLRDNQIIRGIIEDRGGLLKLVLNNREFNWPSIKKFKLGDQITFKVMGSLSGKLLQPVVSDHPASAPASPVLGQASGDNAQRIMSLMYRPEQPSSLTQLFSSFSSDPFLTSHMRSASGARLDQLIYTLARISPAIVRSALINSGLFGEYRIAHNLGQREDIKQLLRNILRNPSAQNSEGVKLDKAVDEIESRQLEALVAQQNREVSYHFVIPFYDSEPVELQFERGSGDFVKGEADWVINLHTKSDSLGEIWAKTTIKASADIEMIFWAEAQETADLARRGKDQLSQILNDFGLGLAKFTVLNAHRPIIDSTLSGPGQVLDVTT
jgi:hypothetical protein